VGESIQGRLKVERLQKGKNNVIIGFTSCLLLNTLIFIDASAA